MAEPQATRQQRDNADDAPHDADANGDAKTNDRPDAEVVNEKLWIPENKYKRMKTKQKQQRINVVFNYSSTKLNENMEKVLNRGLNFALMPLKLDITQVLVDFNKFERTMLWKEFWYEHEESGNRKLPLFKSKKTNYPRNHKTPQELKNYLAAVKSELLDPKNRKKCKPNLPKEELKALLELIKLQKERQIVIKPCDKGAGIFIMDFKDYISSCVEHLQSKTESGEAYYSRAQEKDLNEAKEKILKVVQEGFDNGILSENEYLAMKPEEETKPGRFYALFKMHKYHEKGKMPPLRPIVSQSGSLTKNISTYVESHLKEIAKKHESFLQDTPDFLRQIQL